jgi:DNA-binding beta-propeller fold protein YncE
MRTLSSHRRLAAALFATLPLAAAAWGAEATYSTHRVAMPLSKEGANSMDYIAFDPSTGMVWVPAGSAGVVAVVDPADDKVRTVAGFATAEMGSGDRKRLVGPSSVTIGEGTVYVGNRGDSKICAFDAKSLAPGACHALDSMPDGLAYVASTHEVWVTTPRDKSIRVLDAAKLDEKAKLTFDGNPEGFAVDNVRGRFYTNLEDKDRTLAIDLKSHKTVATWNPACGEDGPHGLRVDAKAGQLFVACSTRAEVLDVAKDGQVLSSIDTGDGVDDIDYLATTHTLYVGAAKAARLTIAAVDAKGKLTLVASVPTAEGARNPAATAKGVVYLAHGGRSTLTELVAVAPKP